MIVQAEISEDGTIKVKNTVLKGRKVFLSLYNPEEFKTEGKMNWPGLWEALENVDKLNLPQRSHVDIIKELRESYG